MSKKISELLPYPEDPRTFVPGARLTSNYLYGVEIELERVASRPPLRYWTWHDDNSLRDNGAEISFQVPLGGVDVERALDEFKQMVELLTKKQKHPPISSERCGVHVHIDFRPCTVEQVVSFFVGFCIFEAALFTIGGKHRYSSIYCPGVSSCTPLIKSINKLYTAGSDHAVVTFMEQWSKYTGVNLRSLVERGSIELRMHEGTIDSEDIMLWLLLLDKLKQYTDSVSPEELVNTAKYQGITFASTVFGDLSSHLMTDNYINFYKNNLRNAFDCVYMHKIYALTRPASSDIKLISEAIIRALES